MDLGLLGWRKYWCTCEGSRLLNIEEEGEQEEEESTGTWCSKRLSGSAKFGEKAMSLMISGWFWILLLAMYHSSSTSIMGLKPQIIEPKSSLVSTKPQVFVLVLGVFGLEFLGHEGEAQSWWWSSLLS